MANTTQTTTVEPTSPTTKKTTTKSTPHAATDKENVTTVDTAETSVTITSPISSTNITSTTHGTEVVTQIWNGDGGKSSTGVIVGGCIGGVVGVIVILAVVWFMKKHRRNRNSNDVPVLPGKDYINTLHEKQAIGYIPKPPSPDTQVTEADVKTYANLKPSGETDEQTDPSVAQDGYLKKTKHNFNSGKQKHKKGQGKDAANHNNGFDELPIYGNEIIGSKSAAKRTNSVPYTNAPPPPSDTESSGGYTEGRIGGNTKEKVDEDEESKGYVNLQGQKKGEPVFNVPPKEIQKKDKTKQDKEKAKATKTEKDKLYVNDPKKESTDSNEKTTKVYENLDDKYYNIKEDNKGKVVSCDEDIQQINYENVGTETDQVQEQDDVYEVP